MHVICRGAGEPTLVLEAGIAGGVRWTGCRSWTSWPRTTVSAPSTGWVRTERPSAHAPHVGHGRRRVGRGAGRTGHLSP
ncbi:MAG: hypothetical protein R2854_23760 [Caldilineaceae bacterium]